MSRSPRRVGKPDSHKLTDGDALVYLSHCLSVAALFARCLDEDRLMGPELHETLKGMQLMVDRLAHSHAKAHGPSKLGKLLPEVPDTLPKTSPKPPPKTRAKMSPTATRTLP